MPIKSKVFIQRLQKSQDRHKISFVLNLIIKSPKTSSGQISPPPPIQLRWIHPPIQLGLKHAVTGVQLNYSQVELLLKKNRSLERE